MGGLGKEKELQKLDDVTLFFIYFQQQQGPTDAKERKKWNSLRKRTPAGARQGQSSAATKGKGRIPYTESVPRHAAGFNMRNNQVRSNDPKGKSIAPPTEKVKKHGGTNCNKTLSIGGGKVAQKIDSTY
ncbi:hypothetical protein FCM35_KLT16886 [Carex littledalei]|uniref:Uncharacterized protein n=1 Tax=Carex littledalei TaxID=544730 RepID=A0A833R774_9POAL|nr:hypothetical protein FCM35_KLT16886 [Carex littledalei]